MKKKVTCAVILLVLILTFPMTGCASKAQSDNKQGAAANPSSQAQQESGKQGDGEISVIAKSGNTVSSDEKEAVLNEITKEMDEMINNSAAMEDIEDSDLNEQ
jgi:putative salt-induced outer membrane protein YdiY